MSDLVELAGDLYLPDVEGPVPGVVLTGPLTGVKEQVTGGYARRLAERGVAALAFDHRNFGASEGQPRQHEDSGGKLSDLRDAVSELAVHERVDAGRLGVVGVCLGGGYAVRFAATDPRVRACAVVGGCFNDPAGFRKGMGPDAYRGVLAELTEVATEERRTGTVAYVAAVSDDDAPAAMPGSEPFEYYGTDRAASPNWENQVTRRSIHSLLTFDAASWAEFLPPTPLLVVHGRRDDYCSPQAAERLAEVAAGEVVWLEAEQHIDLYDVEDYVGVAADALAEFLSRTL